MSAGRRACAALVAAAIAACAATARAQLPIVKTPVPALPDLTVGVLTFGPGDHPFFKFGHDAILIHDESDGSNRVYNFGTFSFDSPRLILDFLHGRMTYWLSVSTLGPTVSSYTRENRSIVLQQLALPPAVARALKDRLDVNAQPQNRAYTYDYFLDNCATRVRDAVDWATGGRLREVGRAPARLSLRDQALRMTASYLPLYLAIDLVLGPAADRKIDRWAEMFIPEELSHALDDTTWPAGTAGAPPVPLAKGGAVLFHADRPDPPHDPPAWRGSFFAAGTAIAVLFWLLAWAATHPALGRGARLAARAALGLLVALWGTVAGFVGSFLIYVWAATDHLVAHRNQNVLVCPPWAFLLLFLGVGIALGHRGSVRFARWLAVAAVAATAAALLLKLGLAQHQDNGRCIAFFAPAWLGLTAALTRLSPR